MKVIRKGRDFYTVFKNKQRKWDPRRSKLAAAMVNGLKDIPIDKNTKILYLGASTGTTVSHLSDIVKDGIIYSLEFSERVFRSLLTLSEERDNIVPLFFDVRKPENYNWIEECDIVYCDIAQSDQTDIAIRNAGPFLKQRGYLFVAIKSQSIDVTKPPQLVYKEERQKIKKTGYEIIDVIELEPWEEKHAMIVGKKK